MISKQRIGCQILIYPGAFNMTTGPLHWELLQRARCVTVICGIPTCILTPFRAVDNQVFVAMCSPARDLTAGYHAVRFCVLRHSKY